MTKRLPRNTKQGAVRITEELDLVSGHIGSIEAEIKQNLSDDSLAPHLLAIPGVGPATTMAFLAFIGDGRQSMGPKAG